MFSLAGKDESLGAWSGRLSQEQSSVRPSSRLVITDEFPSRVIVSLLGSPSDRQCNGCIMLSSQVEGICVFASYIVNGPHIVECMSISREVACFYEKPP